MKLIIAIIQPNKLESVKQALSEVEVFRLTVLDVQGFGRQRGHPETYRGHEIAVNLLRKVQLQIAVNDNFVEPTIAAIVKGGRSGASFTVSRAACQTWAPAGGELGSQGASQQGRVRVGPATGPTAWPCSSRQSR